MILRMEPFGLYSICAAAKTKTIGQMDNFVLSGSPQQPQGERVKSSAPANTPALHTHFALPRPVTLASLSFCIYKSG